MWVYHTVQIGNLIGSDRIDRGLDDKSVHPLNGVENSVGAIATGGACQLPPAATCPQQQQLAKSVCD
jgi:hypothetical protein